MAKLLLYTSALLLVVASIQAELYNFKTGNSELKQALNSALNGLISCGRLDELYEDYLGGPDTRLSDCNGFRDPYTRTPSTFPEPTAMGTLDQVLKRGVLKVGYWDFHEFWQLAVDETGQPVGGFLFRLTNALVESLNVQYKTQLTVEWVSPWTFYPGLLDDLMAAKYDIVVNQLAITAEWGTISRQDLVDFTCSITSDSPAFAISSELEGTIRVVNDLNKAQYTIAVVAGTSNAAYAAQWLFVTNIVEYDNVFQATWAVHRGEADAVLDDSVPLTYACKQYPKAILLGNYDVLQGQGIAVRLDDNCLEECPNGQGHSNNLRRDCKAGSYWA